MCGAGKTGRCLRANEWHKPSSSAARRRGSRRAQPARAEHDVGRGRREDWHRLEQRSAASALDADELLRVLLEHNVEFVVVGGFAVVAHGYTRATKDIDIVPRPTEKNRENLFAALAATDARPIEEGDLRAEGMPVAWTAEALSHGGNWALETGFGRIDILQYIEGVEAVESYTDLRARAFVVDVANVGRVAFAGYEDLVLRKDVAGRPRDLNDLAELREARRETGGNAH
jgi:hypothetical protein